MSNQTIREELALLTVEGMLHPEDVVAFARDPETALHAQFEWDDTEAAHQFRLEQARRVIRVHVVVDDTDGAAQQVRAFVSLSSDRRSGGGYRTFAAVKSDEALYAEMLSDALGQLVGIQRKYQRIKELGRVFRAVDAVAEKQQKMKLEPAT